jgi:hypothetical protein
MNEVLKFLFENAAVKRTGEEWAKRLSVDILDLDGWETYQDFTMKKYPWASSSNV